MIGVVLYGGYPCEWYLFLRFDWEIEGKRGAVGAAAGTVKLPVAMAVVEW